MDLLSVSNILKKNNLKISDHQLQLLDKYVSLLLDWNKKLNLISRRDVHNIWIRHIIGSLSIFFKCKFKRDCFIADAGTGGGLPGIPVAIVSPDSRVTLIDSIRKKIGAVENIINELSLNNVTTVNARIEDLSDNKSYSGKFDYILARAVAPLTDIIRWSNKLLVNINKESSIKINDDKHFISPGSIICWKGGEVSDEILRAQLLFKDWRIEAHSIIVDGLHPDALYDKKFIIAQKGNISE